MNIRKSYSHFPFKQINIRLLISLFLVVIIFGSFTILQLRSIRQFEERSNISYQEALRILVEETREKAKANNCEGIISSITPNEINNFDESITGLNSDLNIVLASFDGWEVEADGNTKAEITTRMDKRLGAFPPEEIPEKVLERIVAERQVAAFTPTFFPMSEWQRGQFDFGNVRLVLSIFSQDGTEVFSSTVSFLHPSTERAKERQKLSAKVSSVISFSGLAILIGYLFIHFGWKRYVGNRLVTEIQKVRKLVDNGHYVTALELTETYLSFFPDDTEMRAFREWLLVFTNNDPQKAQQAFVEARKLKLVMEQHLENPQSSYLTSIDDTSIKQLIPYNPELSNYYAEVKQLEEKNKQRSEFTSKLELLNKLVQDGRIQKAMNILDDLKAIDPDNDELVTMEQKILNMEFTAMEIYSKAENRLKKGDITGAKLMLNEILAQFKDYEKAIHLIKEIENAKGKTYFLLRPTQNNKAVSIFLIDEIFIGRRNVDFIPHIESKDRRVSRKHARIRVTRREVIIEDLKSSGGVFLNGEKITLHKLENSDEINLAGAIDYRILIFRDESGNIAGVIIQNAYCDYLILNNKVSIGFDSKALVFNNTGSLLAYDAEICILTENNRVYVLNEGKEVLIDRVKYMVEEAI